MPVFEEHEQFYDPFFLIKRYIRERGNTYVAKKALLKIGPIGNFYRRKLWDKIMQILTPRYYLEFSKLTLYGITRPQSIENRNKSLGKRF